MLLYVRVHTCMLKKFVYNILFVKYNGCAIYRWLRKLMTRFPALLRGLKKQKERKQ